MSAVVGERVETGCLSPSSGSLAHECDPLVIFRRGLALFRRAGLGWFEAEPPAYDAALRVAPEPERDEWASVLFQTRTTWMRAYERRDTGCAL